MPRGGIAIALESDLQIYLRQINEVALLTMEEELELARTIARASAAAERFAQRKITLESREKLELAGTRARERMIRANLRLVVSIAKRYARRGASLADLIEEGNLGLLRAVELFDPEQGNRFSTYAAWWIRQAIQRSLINVGQPIHIPAYMVEMIARWKEAQKILRDKLGRSPTMEELSEQTQLPERKLRIIKRAIRAIASGTHSPESDTSGSLAEMLPDEKTPSAHDALLNGHEWSTIQKLLDQISEREATILRLRFGLDDGEPMKLKDIGTRLGLTKERVRQIEHEALVKLNSMMIGWVPETPDPATSPARRKRAPRTDPDDE